VCFDDDSRPPIRPIAGGALDGADLTLTSADGTEFRAFGACAAEPTGSGMLILPDVRGLHAYYEELTLRFAEHGIHALAIDYFGRTAGVARRGPGFDHATHVGRTTWDGLTGDVRAGVAHLRSDEGGAVRDLFVVGFCFGGRLAFICTTLDLDLSGAIGFYGWPTGPARNGVPAPIEVIDKLGAPILAIFGGADEAISAPAVGSFEAALEEAGVPHRVITYPGAPHGFFDRKADEYAEASDAAWHEALAFVESRRRTSTAATRP
jgi:carboxymethylenebutenolidase